MLQNELSHAAFDRLWWCIGWLDENGQSINFKMISFLFNRWLAKRRWAPIPIGGGGGVTKQRRKRRRNVRVIKVATFRQSRQVAKVISATFSSSINECVKYSWEQQQPKEFNGYRAGGGLYSWRNARTRLMVSYLANFIKLMINHN